MKSNTIKSALKFMIMVAGAVLTTGLATGGSANPAAAAALYFVPNGQVTGLPGDTITFELALDTTGLDAPLTQLNFIVDRDADELDLLGEPTAFGVLENQSIIRVPQPSGIIAAVTQRTGSTAAPNNLFTISEVSYRLLPSAVLDGVPDDLIVTEIVSAIDTNGNEVNNLFTPGPGTDVEAVPEPTTSAGIALVTAGLIYVRLKTSRSISPVSSKVVLQKLEQQMVG